MRIILGHSVWKTLKIISSFRVDTSENKNTDHWVKGTCTIMLIQITHETKHISLLLDSTISNALDFCSFYVFYCNLKEKDDIRRIIISKKGNIWEISIIIFIYQNCQPEGPLKQKIKLP